MIQKHFILYIIFKQKLYQILQNNSTKWIVYHNWVSLVMNKGAQQECNLYLNVVSSIIKTNKLKYYTNVAMRPGCISVIKINLLSACCVLISFHVYFLDFFNWPNALCFLGSLQLSEPILNVQTLHWHLFALFMHACVCDFVFLSASLLPKK